MKKDVFRPLGLLDGSEVFNVKMDTSSAFIPEGDEVAINRYATMMALLFSTACYKFNGKGDEVELNIADVKLTLYPDPEFPEYIKLFVTKESKEKGGKILFRYNPKQARLAIEFNTLDDNPDQYDASLARAMLGTLSPQ